MAMVLCNFSFQLMLSFIRWPKISVTLIFSPKLTLMMKCFSVHHFYIVPAIGSFWQLRETRWSIRWTTLLPHGRLSGKIQSKESSSPWSDPWCGPACAEVLPADAAWPVCHPASRSSGCRRKTESRSSSSWWSACHRSLRWKRFPGISRLFKDL